MVMKRYITKREIKPKKHKREAQCNCSPPVTIYDELTGLVVGLSILVETATENCSARTSRAVSCDKAISELLKSLNNYKRSETES